MGGSARVRHGALRRSVGDRAATRIVEILSAEARNRVCVVVARQPSEAVNRARTATLPSEGNRSRSNGAGPAPGEPVPLHGNRMGVSCGPEGGMRGVDPEKVGSEARSRGEEGGCR